MSRFVKSMLGGMTVGLMIVLALASSMDTHERELRRQFGCYIDPATPQVCYLVDNQAATGALP